MPASKHDDNHALLMHVADTLISSETTLNELDAKSGDGDTGSTLATAANALKDSLNRLPLADVTQLLPALGNELGQTMGGSSGVILAMHKLLEKVRSLPLLYCRQRRDVQPMYRQKILMDITIQVPKLWHWFSNV